ncbi:MAG TPA: hypothetical protein DCZ91_04995 [Lachnospiraceae bacterium]|nr:hypothetical protein [Lachnospiraceae bacterium]
MKRQINAHMNIAGKRQFLYTIVILYRNSLQGFSRFGGRRFVFPGGKEINFVIMYVFDIFFSK